MIIVVLALCLVGLEADVVLPVIEEVDSKYMYLILNRYI